MPTPIRARRFSRNSHIGRDISTELVMVILILACLVAVAAAERPSDSDISRWAIEMAVR